MGSRGGELRDQRVGRKDVITRREGEDCQRMEEGRGDTCYHWTVQYILQLSFITIRRVRFC